MNNELITKIVEEVMKKIKSIEENVVCLSTRDLACLIHDIDDEKINYLKNNKNIQIIVEDKNEFSDLYIKKLKSLGYKIIVQTANTASKPASILKSDVTLSKKLFVENDIFDLSDNTTLRITKTAIITPLAKDCIVRKKIVVIRENL